MEQVNGAPPGYLHGFGWAADEEIGSLPLEWNWLVGEYRPLKQAKILHYTNGGPWFPGGVDGDHADEWLRELKSMVDPLEAQVLQETVMTGSRGG